METIFTKESMKKAKDSILNLTPFYGEIINFYEKIFPISKVENELCKYFEIIEKELYEEDKKIRYTCRKK